MARSRFVLRYRGEGARPDADVARLQELAGAVILDSSPRMLVVEASPEPLRDLVDSLTDWVMGPDISYQVPDIRKKARRPPE